MLWITCRPRWRQLFFNAMKKMDKRNLKIYRIFFIEMYINPAYYIHDHSLSLIALKHVTSSHLWDMYQYLKGCWELALVWNGEKPYKKLQLNSFKLLIYQLCIQTTWNYMGNYGFCLNILSYVLCLKCWKAWLLEIRPQR